MDTFGTHVLVELHGCNVEKLNDRRTIEQVLRDAATAAGATIVGMVFHQFTPQGVSGVVLVEESHLSIHTWPERCYAAADMFTCGAGAPERACEVLAKGLNAKRAEYMVIERGLDSSPSAIRLVRQHSRPRAVTEDDG